MEHAAAHAAHAHPTHAAHALSAVDTAHAAHPAAGLERIDTAIARSDGDHEVSDGIDLEDEVVLSLFLGRDHHHFVFDDVGKVDLGKDEPQSGSQRDSRHAPRDRLVDVESEVFQGPCIDLHLDPMGVFDLSYHVAKRRFDKVEVLHRLFEGTVNLFLSAPGICQVDRLVLFTQTRDLPPAGSTWIEHWRLVREWDRGNIAEMETIHERPLAVTSQPHALGVVVEDAGVERKRFAQHASIHGCDRVGWDSRSILCELTRDIAFSFGEVGRRLLEALPNAFFHEGVVAGSEANKPILLPLKVADQGFSLAAAGLFPLSDQIAFSLLASTTVSLPDSHLNLASQTIANIRRESRVGKLRVDVEKQALQPFTSGLRVAGHQVAGVTKSNGGFLFEGLRDDLPHAIELKRGVVGSDGTSFVRVRDGLGELTTWLVGCAGSVAWNL